MKGDLVSHQTQCSYTKFKINVFCREILERLMWESSGGIPEMIASIGKI